MPVVCSASLVISIRWEKPNAKGKYPTTKAVALSIIKELPFAPTILNDSGYGVHGLWLFPEPLAIHSEEHRAQLQSLLAVPGDAEAGISTAWL